MKSPEVSYMLLSLNIIKEYNNLVHKVFFIAETMTPKTEDKRTAQKKTDTQAKFTFASTSPRGKQGKINDKESEKVPDKDNSSPKESKKVETKQKSSHYEYANATAHDSDALKESAKIVANAEDRKLPVLLSLDCFSNQLTVPCPGSPTKKPPVDIPLDSFHNEHHTLRAIVIHTGKTIVSSVLLLFRNVFLWFNQIII